MKTIVMLIKDDKTGKTRKRFVALEDGSPEYGDLDQELNASDRAIVKAALDAIEKHAKRKKEKK